MNREINSFFCICLLVVISAIAGVVVWHYGNQGMDSAQIVKINIQNRVASEMNQAGMEDWQNYENADYKFSLVFPDDWKGFKTTERTFDWGTIGKSKSLDFGFPKKDAEIFNIAFVQKKQFKKLQNSGEPFGTYLGENSDVVFVLNQEKYSTDENTAKLLSEVSGIIKSFKVEK